MADIDGNSGRHGLRKRLVSICQQLTARKLVRGTSGNVSVRSDGGILITPTGIPYDVICEDDMVQMSLDGAWDGDVLPSSEWRLHLQILAARADISAVVHTHSPFATAVAILGEDIPAIHYRIAACGGPTIRCAKYATFGSKELADSALVAMDARKACLLAHHGVVAAHQTLEGALTIAEVVEELAEFYIRCAPLGRTPVLDDEEIARVIDKHRTYGQQSSH